MRSILFIALALLLPLPLWADTAATPASIGQILAIEGQATATTPAGVSRPLALKSPVFQNDKINTPKGAKLQILFEDDSIVAQGENSEMTIDEYLYKPGDKNSRCSFHFAAGFFRAITGKITDLNPERFKVKTRRATIGIRGCDLAFRIEPAGENIYILELPDNRSIRIESHQNLPTGTLDVNSVLNALEILDPGTVVHISDTGLMNENPISIDDARLIISATTPPPPLPEQGGTPLGEPGETPAPGDPLNPDSPVPQSSDPASELLSDPTQDPASLTPILGDFANLLPDPTPTLPERIPTPDPVPTEAPPPPPVPGNTKQPMSSGVNWEWGVWKDPQGIIYDAYVTGNTLDPIAAQNVLNGNIYYLTGNGIAGAVIQSSDPTAYIQGPFDMDVTVGNGVAPTWEGHFNLGDANTAQSLIFDANGSIMTDGALSGAANTYNLTVPGATYGMPDLIQNSVQGALVGPGAPSGVSGVQGSFNFGHGPGTPTVNGVFGADLH